MTIEDSLQHPWIKVRMFLFPSLLSSVTICSVLDQFSSHHPLQVIKRRNVRPEESERKPERRRLKTTRLKEYTIKSHSSMPPNNTYINFERFSQVMEEITAAEDGLRELEKNQRSCGEDVAALLSIYEEKEGWYKEENESIAADLSQIKQELQKAQALRRQSQEEARAAMLSANALKRKFGRLENRYEVLAEQMVSEVRWVEELVRSISAENDTRSNSMAWAALFAFKMQQLLNIFAWYVQGRYRALNFAISFM